MSEIEEHVAYLSEQIGPRPAGTEEEQQASTYIAQALEKTTLPTTVEDFSYNDSLGLIKAVCCAITALCLLLAIFLPVMVLPGMIICILTGVIYAGAVFDHPIFKNLPSNGVSQNVVAKYEPLVNGQKEGSVRRRKIIVVSHYDSGHVRKDLSGPVMGILPYIHWAELGAMGLAIVLLLIRSVFQINSGGGLVFIDILTVITLIVALLPVASFALQRTAPYNEGANCNASGVAVLIELAHRVARGRMYVETHNEDDVVMHGYNEAVAQGLIPEGVDVAYDREPVRDSAFAEESPAERLMAAKAAVAALSGKPVSNSINIDVSENLVQVQEPPVSDGNAQSMRQRREETMAAFAPVPQDIAPQETKVAPVGVEEYKAQPAARQQQESVQITPPPAPAPAPAPAPQASPTVPDWFTSAQKKARKQTNQNTGTIHRSRYADALDAAIDQSTNYFHQASQAIETEAEKRLQSTHNTIVEVQAPNPDEIEAYRASTVPLVKEDVATDLPAVVESPRREDQEEAVPAVQESNVQEEIQVPPVRADEDISLPEPYIPTPRDVPALPTEQNQPVYQLPVARPSVAPAATRSEERIVLDNQTGEYQELSADAQDSEQVQLTESQQAVSPTTEHNMQNVKKVLDRTMSFIPVPIDEELLNADPDKVVEMAQVEQPAQQNSSTEPSSHRKKRSMNLPGFTGELASLEEPVHQRAPLAEDSKQGRGRARNLGAIIPSVAADEQPTIQNQNPRNAMLANVPSLSGVIREQAAELDAEETGSINQAGSFASVGATGAFAPVGDELLDDIDPDDIYIDDADDSAYVEELTETGAFAGPGYVDMPKSRVARIFDRFRSPKHKDIEAETPQQWLDVNDDFDARSVGRDRGSWESFRDDDEFDDVLDDEFDNEFAAIDEPMDSVATPVLQSQETEARAQRPRRRSVTPAQRSRRSAHVDPYADDDYDYDDLYGDTDSYEDEQPRTKKRRWNGGAAPIDADVVSDEVSLDINNAEDLISGFKYAHIDTEVWFVALGAELAENGGMKAFIEDHRAELKGAIIIDIEALGAGDLSIVTREGTLRAMKVPSRMKRYIRKATSALGMTVGNTTIEWTDSSAAYALRQNLQVMHLVGVEDGKPALYGEPEDVAANLDPDKMVVNADFITEVLKAI